MPPRKTRAAAAAAASDEAPAPTKASTRTSSRNKKSSPPPSSDPAPSFSTKESPSIVDTVISTASSAVESVIEHVESAVESMTHAEVPSAEDLLDKVEEMGEKVVDAVAGEGDMRGGIRVEQEAKDDEAVEAPKGLKKEDKKGKGKARAEVTSAESEEAGEPASSSGKKIVTMEERQAKLKELRIKMNASSAANRKDLITDHQRRATSAKELANLEKKRKLAEQLREKADAAERGEDTERTRNWEYSIEDSERWEKKLQAKEEGINHGFVDASHSAHASHSKLTSTLKPDLQTYNRQKELALNLPLGTLTSAAASSSSQNKALARMKPMTSDDLYRDANSLQYGTEKPSEDAIDNVVGKLNLEIEARSKHSRKRADDDEGDVTYINDANKVFNKKINRYYDKYTKEIRANFERGTAL